MDEMMMMISARRPNTAAATTGSRIRQMEVFTCSNCTIVDNAFMETQAFLQVKVNRHLRWIHHHHYHDVISSLLETFPLSFQYMFSDMNLHHLGGRFNQLLNNLIPQHFWEEFIGILTSAVKRLADLATQTRLSHVILSVEVDVVRVEPYDEEQYLRHIRSLTQFDPSDDDQSSKSMPASQESIGALETITFKRSLPTGNGTADEEMVDVSCSICLDEYIDGENIKKMPCSHSFHIGCLGRWLKKGNTCPLCRFQII